MSLYKLTESLQTWEDFLYSQTYFDMYNEQITVEFFRSVKSLEVCQALIDYSASFAWNHRMIVNGFIYYTTTPMMVYLKLFLPHLDVRETFDSLSSECRHQILNVLAADATTDMIKLLLDKGLDVNSLTLAKQNLLAMACWENRTDLIKLLLERGVNVNQEDHSGHTAICNSIANENDEALELLTAAGAIVGNARYSCKLPIACAIMLASVRKVELLIRLGSPLSPDVFLFLLCERTFCNQSQIREIATNHRSHGCKEPTKQECDEYRIKHKLGKSLFA